MGSARMSARTSEAHRWPSGRCGAEWRRDPPRRSGRRPPRRLARAGRPRRRRRARASRAGTPSPGSPAPPPAPPRRRPGAGRGWRYSSPNHSSNHSVIGVSFPCGTARPAGSSCLDRAARPPPPGPARAAASAGPRLQRAAAPARKSGARPREPPMTKARGRASIRQRSSRRASCSLLQRLRRSAPTPLRSSPAAGDAEAARLPRSRWAARSVPGSPRALRRPGPSGTCRAGGGSRRRPRGSTAAGGRRRARELPPATPPQAYIPRSRCTAATRSIACM